MSAKEVKTVEEYKKIISSENYTVVLFSAEWALQCKQVLDAMNLLAKQQTGNQPLQFINVCAEDLSEISTKHKIEAVPTVLFFRKGISIDRINGVDVAALTAKCKKYGITIEEKSLEDRLKALINKSKVMIFMKGDRTAPRCGFSKQIIGIINDTGVNYETFDILTDEEVRQGLKTYSDWPTYPQVYVNGELIGGLDIIKELKEGGELTATLEG